ncbi:hypothetical protein [Mesorhizobium sp. DCY119]|uniref:hypothetical protein n=1 Tax=Mesorhizobium sp. DCY119 TaxID=2108445 RepID=UPI000E6B4F9D|nr:hypothetical protein [Mesorhizobium sp. DCY119]RJG46910.1 hypothetical protein D3Y55_23495 [Mesorhizobium sp. DCY119]
MAPIGKEHWLTQRLEQQPDVVQTKLWTVVKPVHHFVRRIMAYDIREKNGLYGVWSIHSLWAPSSPIELENTTGFSTPLPQGEVIVIYPDLLPKPIQYEAFEDTVRDEVLPFLRSINTMERFYHEITNRPANLNTNTPDSKFCLELAMGHFDAASTLLAQHRDHWFRKQDDDFDEQELDQIRQLYRFLDDGNYAAIALHLHEWEASVAEHSELDGLWEPSPFPFEPEYEDWARKSGITAA